MAGKIALVGGDEFRASCAGMDAEILAATGIATPRVVIVPTAAAMERPELAAANGARHFNALGADAAPLMILNADDANDEALVAAADAADVIYLTGGNPAYLMRALADSRLADALRAAPSRGAIVAGSSAGAMALGERMRFKGEWSEGLGLAHGVVVFPHHERDDPKRVAGELMGKLPTGIAALGIDGATGCISTRDGWRVLGAGAVTRYRALGEGSDMRSHRLGAGRDTRSRGLVTGVVTRRHAQIAGTNVEYRAGEWERFGAREVFGL